MIFFKLSNSIVLVRLIFAMDSKHGEISRAMRNRGVEIFMSQEVRVQTYVASVGSIFNDTRKVKVLSLPETIKEKSTFRAKALRSLQIMTSSTPRNLHV